MSRRGRPATLGWASTATTTPGAASRTRWPAWRPAPPTSRARSTATASAAETRTSSRSSRTSSSSSATDCLDDDRLARLTEAAHFARRAAQLHPRPRPALRGAQRLRAQGRHARRRRRRRPGDVRARRPGSGRQRARAADLRAVGQGHGAGARRGGRARRSTTPTAQRVVDRVKELEHHGYHFEAADGSFELLLRKETGDYEPLFRLESWRVIVEKRADGKVETEATIKIWVDGERYVRTAEGNGPVNALDKALRAAHLARSTRTSTTSSWSTSRSASSTRRRAPARSPGCSSTRPTGTTCGARSACPRTSSRPPGRRSSTRWSAGCSRRRPRPPGSARPAQA